MAFGKDPRGADGIAVFGGGTMSQRDNFRKHAQEQAKAERGSSSVPYWTDTFKPPQTHSRLGRFIPGQYKQLYTDDGETSYETTLEYYIYQEHFNAQVRKGAICSAGPLFRNKKKAEPCLGCKIFWEDYEVRRAKKARGDNSKGPNRMSLRTCYAFNWYDYGLFIKLPRTDEKGEAVMNRSTGQQYYDWVMAPPNDPMQSQYESKWGKLLAWPMSDTHKGQLFKYMDMTIVNDCVTCGNRGSIVCVMKVCGNPQCRQPIYDPTNTTLNMEQREKIDSVPYTCPHCGQCLFVDEVISCQACAQHGLQPKRANIFDVDLEIIAVPTGTGMQTNLQFLNRSGPRPIPLDPEIVKTIKPIDLVQKFAPTKNEKQSELWGIPLAGAEQATTGGMPQMQQQVQVPQQVHPPMQTAVPNSMQAFMPKI